MASLALLVTHISKERVRIYFVLVAVGMECNTVELGPVELVVVQGHILAELAELVATEHLMVVVAVVAVEVIQAQEALGLFLTSCKTETLVQAVVVAVVAVFEIMVRLNGLAVVAA